MNVYCFFLFVFILHFKGFLFGWLVLYVCVCVVRNTKIKFSPRLGELKIIFSFVTDVDILSIDIKRVAYF